MNDEDLAVMVKRELTRISADVNAGLGSGKLKIAELQARLLDVEQKSARARDGGGGGGFELGTAELHAAFEKAPGLQDMRERRQGARCSIDLPQGYFSSGMRAAVLGPAPGQTDRPTLIVPMPRQRLSIRNLLQSMPTTESVVSYVQQVTSVNAAGPVSESTLKAQSTMSFTLKSAPIITLAHFSKASTQVLDDFSSLTQFIDGQMRYGLALVEEGQLLKGSGVGLNLAGLSNVALPFADGTAGRTNLDMLRRGAADLELSGFTPSGVVLHPTDWANIELLKSSTNEYIISVPRATDPSQVWQMHVVSSPSQTPGQFLIGDFSQCGYIADRWLARVEIATQNEDDFIRNLVTFRAEERIALVTTQPGALRKGTLT